VAGPDEARRLADHVARYPALALTGVQGYGGHWQHIEGFDERREAVSAGMERLDRGPVRLTLPTP
jgi:D-serine deaminase-like pyridoxal phosphate-dependent protein